MAARVEYKSQDPKTGQPATIRVYEDGALLIEIIAKYKMVKGDIKDGYYHLVILEEQEQNKLFKTK